MKNKAVQISNLLNELSFRERLIILTVAIVSLVGIYDYVALTPYLEQSKKNKMLLNTHADEMSAAQNNIDLLVKKLEHDPNKWLHKRIAKKENQLNELQALIGESTQGLIRPEKMSQVLGYLLSRQSGMEVKVIKNFPAEPVSFKKSEQDKPEVLMYRHRLVLKFKGSYYQVVNYLKMIEGLKERLYWDDMKFSMKRYPKGEFLLEVHTLSMSRELIGIYE
ncbi:MAG: hypothetical protein CSA49_05330 [Gammaproteobacteria bacterium]|nr:MAG: hypothetical protein CSA49_05330 [Gammaproteobacteria bacterium]